MRIVDDFPLPIKIVSEDEKKRMESELRKNNRALRRLHEKAKSQGFVGSRRLFFAKTCQGAYDLPLADMAVITNCKSMEQDFLAVYSRLLLKISRQWSSRLDNSLSKCEICSVAIEAFLKAFCCFTKDDVTFSAYLFKSVERHIQRFASRSCNPLSIPDRIVKLKHKVGNMMRGGMSFDSSLESLGLPEKTGLLLARSMVEVTHLGLEKVAVQAENLGTDTFRLLPAADLSGLDLLVFQEFMNSSGNMNLSDLARKTINPKTGKPYSKMSMSLAWRRVRDRMSECYGRVA